jgi:ABC-type phosphate transport system substrate-binding protein
MSDPTVTYTHEDVVALAALMEASIGASSADRRAAAVQAEAAVTAKLEAMGLKTTAPAMSARAERYAESYAPRAE